MEGLGPTQRPHFSDVAAGASQRDVRPHGRTPSPRPTPYLTPSVVPAPLLGTVPTMAEPSAAPAIRSVLRHLDVAGLQAGTRQESRSRQRHLPPISVYRWWAR